MGDTLFASLTIFHPETVAYLEGFSHSGLRPLVTVVCSNQPPTYSCTYFEQLNCSLYGLLVDEI